MRKAVFAAVLVFLNLMRASAELEGSEPPTSFWSFQPIRHPTPPAVKDEAWALNPVDRFILAELEKHGLRPAVSATKLDLVRRVYFDLTGLPPSPSDVDGFIDDSAPDAFERLVDRLLNSPRYGERWGQHWLDVVRFAETEGFEYDRHLPDAWRFRDYVIESFNRDKPFDRFVVEQLAGDEMNAEDPELLTASIFHRIGPIRRNAGNPDVALSRNEVLTERTDILGSALLGLTIGCARCHDHKFDPIPQQDYYRLQAFLAATDERDVILASEEERTAWTEQTKQINAELKRLRRELEKTEDSNRREQLRTQLQDLENQVPAQPPTIPSTRNDWSHRTAIHVLKRGIWEQKAQPVAPRTLSVLTPSDTPELAPDFPQPRTQLARWLTNPIHPLTARVIVNRLWQQHFGMGLVKTANDFGKNGERPSHPELLDWLASELMQNGWRLKPMHRLLLLSSAYRQSSSTELAGPQITVDADNRLLWKFNRRRLSAEEIRDAMLTASGKLNLKAGGPSVIVPADQELIDLLYKPSQWHITSDRQEHYRRSIYLIAKRNLRLPFMEVFDQPALLTSCARRESSTHAPQALELLNGRLANELADAFAERLLAEAGPSNARQIDRGYLVATGRLPTSKERELALRFLQEQPLKEFTLAIFNLNAFLYVR